MEFPHRHGHGHGRRDDDDDSDRRAPAPAYGGGREDDYGRHAPAPAYGAPAPAYGREDDYGRHAPAPAYGGGREDDYGRHAPAPAYGGGREDDYGRHAPAPAHGGGGGYGAPAPAAYGGGGREDDYGRHAPAPAYGGGGGGGGYGAPAHGNVVHVSHESGDERPHYGGGGYGNETRPHHGGGAPPPAAARQQTYRIVCKAGEDGFSLASRDGKACLVHTHENDDAQHWIKDMKFSTRVKDEEGYPAIALVNKATGEALKHSLGKSHPVLLTRYNPDSLDESILWTESKDVGAGYRCIRMVNNIYLNFDALNSDPNQGGSVRDGTTVILWEWTEGDNQRWKIVSW